MSGVDESVLRDAEAWWDDRGAAADPVAAGAARGARRRGGRRVGAHSMAIARAVQSASRLVETLAPSLGAGRMAAAAAVLAIAGTGGGLITANSSGPAKRATGGRSARAPIAADARARRGRDHAGAGERFAGGSAAAGVAAGRSGSAGGAASVARAGRDERYAIAAGRPRHGRLARRWKRPPRLPRRRHPEPAGSPGARRSPPRSRSSAPPGRRSPASPGTSRPARPRRAPGPPTPRPPARRSRSVAPQSSLPNVPLPSIGQLPPIPLPRACQLPPLPTSPRSCRRCRSWASCSCPVDGASPQWTAPRCRR